MKSMHTSTILLLIISQVLGKINYCHHVKNCAYIKNIVCQRNNICEPIGDCTEIQLKRSTKIYILLSLNEYRNDVALGKVRNFPNASDMVTQYWDNDLEYVTKCAQNTCEKQEEICANTAKYSHTILLQKVMLITGATGEVDFFAQTIKAWMNPGKFTRGQINEFSDISSLSYAAVLWCNSPAIGCALSRDSNFYYGACTFAIKPSEGEHVYHAGAPCSGCPRGLVCNEEYHGLCGEIMLPRSYSRGPENQHHKTFVGFLGCLFGLHALNLA